MNGIDLTVAKDGPTILIWSRRNTCYLSITISEDLSQIIKMHTITSGFTRTYIPSIMNIPIHFFVSQKKKVGFCLYDMTTV